MEITLEKIESEQTKLSQLIEKFKEQEKLRSAFPLTIEHPVLNEGERFVGVIVSADCTKRHAIILLPGQIEDANWEKAKKWAKSIGGELPDRVESALLFSTMKDEFSENYYLTRDAYGSSYAWFQLFYYGSQDYYNVDYYYRARAVRRLAI